MTNQDYPDKIYAVRASEKFAAQSEAAYDRLEMTNLDAAEDWRTGLQRAKSSWQPFLSVVSLPMKTGFIKRSTQARRFGSLCTGTDEALGDFC